MVKFGPKRDKMEQKILSGVAECIKKLDKLSGAGESLDVLPVFLHCVGNVMNSIVFGVVYEEQNSTWKWLQHLQEEGTKHIGVAGPINFLPFLRYVPRFNKVMQSLIDGKEKTHVIYQEIIDKHIEKKGSDENSVEDLVDGFLEEKARRGDDNSFYSNMQFNHLLADMFGAGVDTTTATIRWFILFMAEYSDVQRKVQEEIDGLIGNRAPTLEDLTMLPYTEAALAETQRIRSVVPVGIPHGSIEHTTLAGYHIPKGTMIVPLQWAVHMDPQHWSEPEVFKPERFLSQDGRFNKPEAFIPFQTGKRMCVGEELGRMLLFLFGATIIHRFTVSPPDGVELDLEGECGITLTPKAQKLIFTSRH
ncbi:hypothetical protein L9F63_016313 [Diploptera punctata]|uniref:Cytochrome P450 n=1 Tax=Diploptera punctata TaxID=6984 RepID=A0AAD8A2P8_DIPPU|nr:hypothetical protein L9F63_016313 [Diploptera punctata]